MFIVSEGDEPGRLVEAIIIILSNPSSTDVIVVVISTDGTACGKHC